jgi:hypothetical protein
VRGRILPNVKFKRKSVKFLSLSELTNLRKSSEVEVSKGKVPLFGRQMDEICSEKPRSVVNVGYGKERGS